MAKIKAKGIIIKQTDYGEGHRMLSVFTEEYGIVKAVSYGAKKSKSSKAASSQFLNWGEFEFYDAPNSDVMTVNSIDVADAFYPLSEDIKKLALCVYMSDITYGLLGMNNPDDRILHLLLNSVYALAYKNEDITKIKAVYELKLMCAGGYEPSVHTCASCGENDVLFFDLYKGGMVCENCAGKDAVKIDLGLHRAIAYITSCPDRKMLAFKAKNDLIERLSHLTEKYVTAQLDNQYPSLDYYNLIK